jgi:hypothetical protein
MKYLKLFEAFDTAGQKITFANDLYLTWFKPIVRSRLKKFLDSVELHDDETVRTWREFKVGDSFDTRNSKDLYLALPTDIEDKINGKYELSVISIKRTNHFLRGEVNQHAFDYDNDDGWHTGRLNLIKKNFEVNRAPIVVIEDKDGLYSVLDGHHRLVVADGLGRKSILALVFKNQTAIKHEWQDDLDLITQLYINRKSGQLTWEFAKKFTHWIEELIKDF